MARTWIALGVFADPLTKQLGTRSKDVAFFQADADAICRLSIRQVLTAAQVEAARRKLVKQIGKWLQERKS